MAGTELHLKTALGVICLFVVLNQCGSSFYGSKGVKVKCEPEYIQVTIDRGKFHYLDPGTFRVGNTQCKPDFTNRTVIVTRIPLFGRCGSRVSDYADMLVFKNVLHGRVYWHPSGITRYPDHDFRIECMYFRTAKLTLKSFTPDDKLVVRPPTFGSGKFKFTMEMFKTGAYKDRYTNYPVRVDLNERIYLQVKTYKNHNNLILFLENCRATLSSNPNDEKNYTLIANGCPLDLTVNLKQEAKNYQRFSLKTFRFVTKNGIQSVYLHCEILMCFKANKESRCKRDCRTKRSALESDNVNLGNKKYIATLGPLRAPSGNDSAPTPGEKVSGRDVGAIVSCDSDYMRLYIDKAKYPYIDPTSFVLNATGEGCNLYTANKTHVVSMIPLDRCGTIVSEYADLLTFYNNLNTEVKRTETGITRHPAVEFKFECSYFRTSTKSLVAFNPKGRIVTRPTAETGNFTFKMEMFQTDKFQFPYMYYPVKVHLKERIFLQVKMKGNTSDLVLFLENCRATPSSSINDTTGYEIIRNGCPVDPTLNLKQGNKPKQRFSLSAFRFIPGVQDVYLHCQVTVCHKQNKESRCSANCTNIQPTLKPNAQIRLRRKLTVEANNFTNVTELGTRKYITFLGPIRILLDEAKKPVIIGVRSRCSVTSYGWPSLLFSVLVVMATSLS